MSVNNTEKIAALSRINDELIARLNQPKSASTKSAGVSVGLAHEAAEALVLNDRIDENMRDQAIDMFQNDPDQTVHFIKKLACHRVVSEIAPQNIGQMVPSTSSAQEDTRLYPIEHTMKNADFSDWDVTAQ